MGNQRDKSVGVRVPRLLAVAAGGLALSCSQAPSGITAKPAPYSTQNTDTVTIYPTEQNYTYTLGNGVDTYRRRLNNLPSALALKSGMTGTVDPAGNVVAAGGTDAAVGMNTLVDSGTITAIPSCQMLQASSTTQFRNVAFSLKTIVSSSMKSVAESQGVSASVSLSGGTPLTQFGVTGGYSLNTSNASESNYVYMLIDVKVTGTKGSTLNSNSYQISDEAFQFLQQSTSTTDWGSAFLARYGDRAITGIQYGAELILAYRALTSAGASTSNMAANVGLTVNTPQVQGMASTSVTRNTASSSSSADAEFSMKTVGWLPTRIDFRSLAALNNSSSGANGFQNQQGVDQAQAAAPQMPPRVNPLADAFTYLQTATTDMLSTFCTAALNNSTTLAPLGLVTNDYNDFLTIEQQNSLKDQAPWNSGTAPFTAGFERYIPPSSNFTSSIGRAADIAWDGKESEASSRYFDGIYANVGTAQVIQAAAPGAPAPAPSGNFAVPAWAPLACSPNENVYRCFRRNFEQLNAFSDQFRTNCTNGIASCTVLANDCAGSAAPVDADRDACRTAVVGTGSASSPNRVATPSDAQVKSCMCVNRYLSSTYLPARIPLMRAEIALSNDGSTPKAVAWADVEGECRSRGNARVATLAEFYAVASANWGAALKRANSRASCSTWYVSPTTDESRQGCGSGRTETPAPIWKNGRWAHFWLNANEPLPNGQTCSQQGGTFAMTPQPTKPLIQLAWVAKSDDTFDGNARQPWITQDQVVTRKTGMTCANSSTKDVYQYRGGGNDNINNYDKWSRPLDHGKTISGNYYANWGGDNPRAPGVVCVRPL